MIIQQTLKTTSSTTIHIVNKMKDKYFEFWRHKITNSSKLSLFCTLKREYKMEQYLSIISKTHGKENKNYFNMQCPQTIQLLRSCIILHKH